MTSTSVLIVEDELIIARDIQSTLERLGYAVTAAVRTGEEAVRKAGETRPDLALMDIVLAGEMDGIEAIRQIIECQKEAHILVLTSFVGDDKVFLVIKVGVLGYLLKDSEPVDLLRVIR